MIDTYRDFKFGLVNALPMSEIPKESVFKSQNIYHKDGRWRKLPGLTETHATPTGTNGVWSVFKSHQLVPKSSVALKSTSTSVYKQNPNTTWTSIFTPVTLDAQIEYLEYPPYVYFGSKDDLWRRFDGGAITYPVGGSNGLASDAPRKFSKIVYNNYAGRFFGIGARDNPDALDWSAHTDNEGIEKWSTANRQFVESVGGDTPQSIDIFEGRLTIASQHSIHSATVVGVPETWSFQREQSQSGAVAGRTFKRFGRNFFMLTPDHEIYKWPENIFITKGRVKLKVNSYFNHLACAEIVENRYYVLVYLNSEGAGDDRYDMMVYDVLTDQFSGPHKQYNIISMFWDKDTNLLLCGGADNLYGTVMEFRGNNIRGKKSSVHWVGPMWDGGESFIDKRYERIWVKAKQSGSSTMELITNVDSKTDTPQSQHITLEDPPNTSFMDTGAVRDAVTKKGYIFDQFGRGNAIQVEIKHSELNGEFEFSELQIEYQKKPGTKFNRGV